jgi:hypothetical protein
LPYASPVPPEITVDQDEILPGSGWSLLSGVCLVLPIGLGVIFPPFIVVAIPATLLGSVAGFVSVVTSGGRIGTIVVTILNALAAVLLMTGFLAHLC